MGDAKRRQQVRKAQGLEPLTLEQRTLEKLQIDGKQFNEKFKEMLTTEQYQTVVAQILATFQKLREQGEPSICFYGSNLPPNLAEALDTAAGEDVFMVYKIDGMETLLTILKESGFTDEDAQREASRIEELFVTGEVDRLAFPPTITCLFDGKDDGDFLSSVYISKYAKEAGSSKAEAETIES